MVQNIFAENAQRYLDAGYSPLPITPGGKAPGYIETGYSRGLNSWQDLCSEPASESRIAAWSRDGVKAGIGLALGYNGVVAIDLDYGEGRIREIIEDLLPDSEYSKVGRNGYTKFYFCEGMKSRKISAPVGENGKLMSVCEVLADGKQTVIPPTIHPNTGRAYAWEEDPLSMVRPENLPEIDLDFADQVVAALEAEGFMARAPQRVRDREDNGDASPTWTKLKEMAISNLDAWVPALQGGPTRLRDGRYRMAAHWRGGNNPSSVGISNSGIVDFGSGEGDGDPMTPIDLVMNANSLSQIEAFNWLDRYVWGGGKAEMHIERQNNLARKAYEGQMEDGVDSKYESYLRDQQEAQEAAEARSEDESEPEGGETGHWGVGSAEDYEGDHMGSENRSLQDFIFASQVPEVREPTGDVLMDAEGLMGDLISYFMNSAKQPSMEIAGGSAISLMTALFGRRWAMRYGADGYTFPNIYITVLASSGFGKSTAANMANRLYRDMAEQGINNFSLPDGYVPSAEDDDPEKVALAEREAMMHITRVITGVLSEGDAYSRGGIHGELLRSPLRSLIVDEAGDFLTTMFAERGSNAMTMRRIMKQLTTLGEGILGSELKADAKMSKTQVFNPHFSMLMQSTHDAYYNDIPASAFKDGFMGRFLLLDERSEPQRPRRVGDTSIEREGIIRRGSEIVASRVGDRNDLSLGGYMLSEMPIDPIAVARTPDAEEALDGAEDWHWRTNQTGGGDRPDRDIWNRFLEMAQKLALLHALGKDWRDPIVDGDDMRFGIRLAYASTATLAQRLKDGAEVKTQQTEVHKSMIDRITRYLINNKGYGPRKQMINRMKADPQVFDRAINAMMDGGLVQSGTMIKGSGIAYRMVEEEAEAA